MYIRVRVRKARRIRNGGKREKRGHRVAEQPRQKKEKKCAIEKKIRVGGGGEAVSPDGRGVSNRSGPALGLKTTINQIERRKIKGKETQIESIRCFGGRGGENQFLRSYSACISVT